MPEGHKIDNSRLLTDARVRSAKQAGVSDKVVAKALAAYEELPPLAGREDRMRVAIAAVMKDRPAPAKATEEEW